MMTCQNKRYSPLTARVTANLTDIAIRHRATELWLFGSASNKEPRSKPRDVDVAFVCRNEASFESLHGELNRRFPGALIQKAESYVQQRSCTRAKAQFHFVVLEPLSESHPIATSIRLGSCLWSLSAT